MAALSAVLMRAIRQATGNTWGARDVVTPNHEILKGIGQISLECLVRRRRLLLLARILQHGAPSLVALVATKVRGQHLPWLQMVIQDMTIMRKMVSAVSGMPDPEAHLEAWIALMRDWPHQWRKMVARLESYDSVAADKVSASKDDNPAEHLHVCDDCQDKFATPKALAQHRRRKHGQRSDLRLYLPADGTCPCCNRCYASRLRLSAHVNDKRRGAKCMQHIVDGKAARLTDEQAAKLDEEETRMRLEARKAGHTQPLVK